MKSFFKNKTNNVRIIKKYKNRKLYDTEKSMYVTLNDLEILLNNNILFKVIDQKQKQDATKDVLIKIYLNKLMQNKTVNEKHLKNLIFKLT